MSTQPKRRRALEIGKEQASKLPLPVKFLTEKDASFRTYHADGAWGMINNHANIQLNFFVERPPMASDVTYQLDEKGSPIDQGNMTIQQEKGHFLLVREYQSAVVLSLPCARIVHSVLGSFIKIAENLVANKNSNDKQA
jgi:hypothetical protein